MFQSLEERVWPLIASHPYLIGCGAILSALLCLSVFPARGIYGSLERVGSTIFERKAVHVLVQNGYDKIIKTSEKPFVVNWWAKDYIILPPKYLSDLRTAGRSHLSFFQNINDALFLSCAAGDLYTAHESERMVDVVKRSINPQLPQITPLMLDEITYAFEKQLGKFEGWKEVTGMDFFSGVANRVATRILISDELCRDEKFLQLSASFLNSIFITALVIVKLPLGPFRNLLSWPLSRYQSWKLRQCSQIVLPLVRRSIEERKSTGSAGKQRLNALEWTLDYVDDFEAPHNTPEKITDELLYGLWAGSSAPGGMMTETVFQLLLFPQYTEPLREEATAAVENHGWSEKMLNSLKLQDSFIREVNRLYPTGSITCSRTVLGRPFEFSDGLTLPVGSRFGFPIKAIQNDPDTFSNPTEFDGFRFAKQGSGEDGIAESNKRWGATSMGTTNLAWGYGNHICPGRFFAVREMKLALTKLLLEYDIKWERSESGRPPPVHVEGQFVPNLSQKIFLKKRGCT